MIAFHVLCSGNVSYFLDGIDYEAVFLNFYNGLDETSRELNGLTTQVTAEQIEYHFDSNGKLGGEFNGYVTTIKNFANDICE